MGRAKVHLAKPHLGVSAVASKECEWIEIPTRQKTRERETKQRKQISQTRNKRGT